MLFNDKMDKSVEDNCDLFMNGESSDVMVIIGSTVIPAHKSILMKNSEYFNAMFSTEMTENNENEVKLEEVLCNQFKFVLRLAYGYKINNKELRIIGFNEIFDAIIVANKYHFKAVEHILTDQFFDKLNTSFSHDYLCISETNSIGKMDRLLTLNEVHEISKLYNLEYFSDLCQSYIDSKSHRGIDAYKYCYNLWC